MATAMARFSELRGSLSLKAMRFNSAMQPGGELLFLQSLISGHFWA